MDKFILKSKTVQGIILTALPQLDALLGLDWLASLGPQVDTAMTAALTVVGALWGIYGRIKAEGGVNFTGSK